MCAVLRVGVLLVLVILLLRVELSVVDKVVLGNHGVVGMVEAVLDFEVGVRSGGIRVS